MRRILCVCLEIIILIVYGVRNKLYKNKNIPSVHSFRDFVAFNGAPQFTTIGISPLHIGATVKTVHKIVALCVCVQKNKNVMKREQHVRAKERETAEM